MIGIIGAMLEEIEVIKNEMKNISEEKINNIIFYKGYFNDKEVILVQSGIGMVNISILSTLLIEKYKVKKIYFSGVAGSLNEKVNIGDIIIADSLEHYLFDASAFGYKIGEIPRMQSSIFYPNETLIDAKEKLKYNKVYYGKIVSGDKFVESKLEKKKIGLEFNALAVDMESSALAHVCYILGVDFLVIRSISDSLGNDSTLEFDKFVNLAAQNSKNILKKLI